MWLTTDGIASSATIAVVAYGNATVAAEISRVVVSSVGVVAVVVTTVAPITTNSDVS